MDDLTEKLLPQTIEKPYRLRRQGPEARNRLTLAYKKTENINDSSFQFQTSDDVNRRLYHSIIDEPELVWNSEEIMERSMLMQEENVERNAEPSEEKPQTTSYSSKAKQDQSQAQVIGRPIATDQKKKTELNSRLFHMKAGPRNFIYWFNLFFNILFRIGLVILLIELIVEGDGDKDEREERIFIQVLLGLQGLVALLYFLALTKILYTKSSDISVYFQKEFYEKPYAEIHMSRIMRKHFTLNKIVSNLCRLANPFTKFSKDIRIAVFRQEIYKRIELVIVFLPLLCVFLMGTPWFDRTDETEVKFDVKLLLAIVVCMEGIHIILHYLFVYIFS